MLPVAALRTYATAVEAGIALVLAAPDKRAVHKLRTATRRVEAQLELLNALHVGILEDDPEGGGKVAAKARKVRGLLAKVRKDAGHVRDFDVQLEMVAEALHAATDLTRDGLQAEAEKLSTWLTRKRENATAALLKDLSGHAAKLAPKTEALVKLLKPAAHEGVTRAHLLEVAHRWHAERTRGLVGKRGEQALHDRRKAAKVARYLLETAGPGGGLRKAAAAYEAVQESGGVWHDNLVLRQLAARRLGKKALLAAMFGEREEAALVLFQQHLQGMQQAAGA